MKARRSVLGFERDGNMKQDDSRDNRNEAHSSNYARAVPRPYDEIQGGLTTEDKRRNVIRLAFGDSDERFAQFCRVIKEEIPPDTGVILRGSAVTGFRWRDGAPFDADGPGTSDL